VKRAHTHRSRRARSTVAVATVSLFAVLFGAIGYSNATSAGTATRRATTHVSAIASLESRFALLRRPAGNAPPQALAAAVAKAPASYGLDLAGARRASATNAWLVPGDGWLCIAAVDAEGLGLSCTAAASAERGELTLTERSTATGEEHIVGACPDGYSTISAIGGGSAKLASSTVRENTYSISARNAARMAVG
jgi:hypothetical protein